MSFLSIGDKDNDEDFFGGPPSGGQSSNLGSLFGMNSKMDRSTGSNQSLTYTAPKPPRPDKGSKDASEKKPPQGGGIAVASAITAYRYVNNQYKLQGKLGIALLSNFAEKDYKILMYVSKQQPVSTAKVAPDFQFNVQANNYASFYDDQRQMWSVLFDSAEHVFNFAKQMCLAKFQCQSQASVVIQDLQVGENDTEPLKPGDLVETKYTGWLVQSQTGSLGAVFDSNHKTDKTFRFKIGKGKVIKGWEEGMVGMKKAGKRFLVIPPIFAYGAKGAGSRVPPNSILAFEVDILRIKHQGSASTVQGSNSTDSVPQTLEQNEPNFGTSLEAPFSGVPTATTEENVSVKGRTASFNEQMAHGNTSDGNKAKLVSRMAKVGHAMLPPQPGLKTVAQQPSPAHSPVIHVPEENNPAANSDHPMNDQTNTPIPSASQFQANPQNSYSPNLSPAPTPGSQMFHPPADYQRAPASQMVPQLPVQYMQHSTAPSAFLPSGIMSTYSQVPRSTYNAMQSMPLSGADMLPSILLESQSNGSKLKTLMEKVDDISDKIARLKSASESHMPSLNHSSMEIMDAAQLSFNIQRIVQENERVKKQILDRDKLVQTQSDKITNLLQQNQKLMEESHEQMEKRNVSFKERFGQTHEKTLELEQQKLDLTSQLSEAMSKISNLQTNLTRMTERSNILEEQLKASSEQSVDAATNKHKVSELNNELTAMSLKVKSLEQENRKLKEDVSGQSIAENEMKQQILLANQEAESGKINLQKEIHDLKKQHENQIKSLQEEFHKESSDATALRAKLEESWKEKCKEAVVKVRQAAEEEMEGLNTEKEALVKKLELFQEKFLQLRGMYEEKAKSELKYKEQSEELEAVQERYDNLRKQALAMKQKYEEKIQELKESLDQKEDNSSSNVDATVQVKSVMNKVFQQTRAEISPSDEYTGSDVLNIILNIIKSTTLTLLTPGQAQENDAEDDEAEEETQEEDGNKGVVDTIEDESKKEEDQNLENSGDHPETALQEQDDVGEEVEKTSDVAKVSAETDIPESKESPKNQTPEFEHLQQSDEKQTAIGPPQEVATLSDVTNEVPISRKENAAEEPVADPVTTVNSGIADVTQQNADLGNQENGDSNANAQENPRTESPTSDAKPSPPPLFDDDYDDSDDLDWLKQ